MEHLSGLPFGVNSIKSPAQRRCKFSNAFLDDHGISNERPLAGNNHGCCCSSSLPQPGGHQEGRFALTMGPSLDLALSCLPLNAACNRSSASARPLPSPATNILPTGRAAPSAYTSMPSSRTPVDKCMNRKVNGRQPAMWKEAVCLSPSINTIRHSPSGQLQDTIDAQSHHQKNTAETKPGVKHLLTMHAYENGNFLFASPCAAYQSRAEVVCMLRTHPQAGVSCAYRCIQNTKCSSPDDSS